MYYLLLSTLHFHSLVVWQSFNLEKNPLLVEFLCCILDRLFLKSGSLLSGTTHSTFALSTRTSLGQLVETRRDVLLVESHLLLVELSLAAQFIQSFLKSSQLLLTLLSVAMLVTNVLQENQ